MVTAMDMATVMADITVMESMGNMENTASIIVRSLEMERQVLEKSKKG